MAKYLTSDQREAHRRLRECRHPWKDLQEASDGRMLCKSCVTYLSKTQVRLARSDEEKRLHQVISEAHYDLWQNDSEDNLKAYQDALAAYSAFVAVHNDPLPI